jgi:mannose-6-phosphate isomerase-like protein (cupin superfamily)
VTLNEGQKSSSGFFEVARLLQQRSDLGTAYLEFLNVKTLSAGVYVLGAGATDAQSPHQQDEVYYVIRGQARMRVGAEDRVVSAGAVIFVRANEKHVFHDIEEELVFLVFFAPAENL